MNPWLPVLAVVGAAVGEGGAAALGVMAVGGVPLVHGLLAFSGAAGCVLLWGLPVAGVALGAGRIEGIRRLAVALRTAFGGSADEGPGSSAILLAVLGTAAAATAAVGFTAGEPVIGSMSHRFAGLVLTALGVAVGGGVLVLGAALGPPTAALVRRGLESLSSEGRRAVAVAASVALVGAVAAALRLILPWPYVALPVGAVCGGLAAVAMGRRWRATVRRPAMVTLALWLVAWTLPFALPTFPGEVRSALWYRAPYAGLGLGAAQPLLDVMGGARGRGVPATAAESHGPAPRWQPPRPLPSHLPETVPRPQSFVLVQIDALRPDHLGFAGYHRPTSPRLDRFRKGATWWKNAYTPAPSTRFAMAALFTGRDPRRAPHQDLGGNRFRLLPGARTVPEALKESGYRRHGLTISYVKHHNKGLGQGFEQWKTPWHVDAWKQAYGKAAAITSDAAIDWLDDHPPDGDPFFLFLHYRCTHDPYIKHDEWDFGNADVDRYDSALAYCDREIGRVLDVLEARADYDRTAVAFFSDHGELFGEHGHANHGNTLYEPDVRILLLTRIPGISRRTVEHPVVLTDVAPTLLELAAAEPLPEMDGRSLLPLALGEPPARKERPLFMFTDLWRGTVHYRASAVLDWPLKLIRDDRLGVLEMYDVEADPQERRDLSRRREDDVARLSALLDGYAAYVADDVARE